MKPDTNSTIKSAELVQLLKENGAELSYRQLQNIADGGYFPKPDGGLWSKNKVLLGLVRYYRRREDARAVSTLDAKRQEKLDLESQLLRRKLEEKDKLWVRAADVEHAWAFTDATLKARIISFDMPAKLKTSLLETLAVQPDYDPTKAYELEINHQ